MNIMYVMLIQCTLVTIALVSAVVLADSKVGTAKEKYSTLAMCGSILAIPIIEILFVN